MEGRISAKSHSGLVVSAKQGYAKNLLEAVALLEGFTPEISKAFKRCTKENRLSLVKQLVKLGVNIEDQNFEGTRVRSNRDPLMMNPEYITLAIFNHLGSDGSDEGKSVIILYYQKQPLISSSDMYSDWSGGMYRSSPGERSWSAILSDADYFYCVKIDEEAAKKAKQLRATRSKMKAGAVNLDRDKNKQYKGKYDGMWHEYQSSRMSDSRFDKSGYLVDKSKYVKLLMSLDLDTTMVSFGKKLSSFMTSIEDKYNELKPILRSMSGSEGDRDKVVALGSIVTEGDRQFRYVANALQQVNEAKSAGVSESAINWYIRDLRSQMKDAKDWMISTSARMKELGIDQ
jgi:hypothetical protein